MRGHNATTMFARFRPSPYRLQVSIVETRRVGGKVRHEHIASLGSIETPLSVANWVAFWQRVHERLAKLSNWIDPATQGKIRGVIHSRIPMVTPDEQRGLQLENAEADERFWTSLQDMNQSTVEEHKALAAAVEQAIASSPSRGSAAPCRRAGRACTAIRLNRDQGLAASSRSMPPEKSRLHYVKLIPDCRRDQRPNVAIVEDQPC
jgi:hypothetical protein